MQTPADERVVLFAGPTLAASALARSLVRRRRWRVRPPVRRLDVAKLTAAERRPGILVIVDGLFHDTLAVGHAEIREAMRRGWQVWGLSSMGAIRAHEMAPLGMNGFGRVFERFEAEEDFQDDEVALLHEPYPPFRPVTEPLVHLRTAVEHLVAEGIVSKDEGRGVVAELKSRWYGERTVRGTIEALTRRTPERTARVRLELSDFRRFSLKTLDLERFIEEHAW
jgi:hypothetical protein